MEENSRKEKIKKTVKVTVMVIGISVLVFGCLTMTFPVPIPKLVALDIIIIGIIVMGISTKLFPEQPGLEKKADA